MLKKPLFSPISVVKNLKAGTSKIHRNSLLPLRTSENCLFVLKKGGGERKKRKKEKQGRNLNSETKSESQIWWFSVTMGNFQGEGGEGGDQRCVLLLALVRLTDFHLPHPAALLYSALHHHPACLRSKVSGYHVAAA